MKAISTLSSRPLELEDQFTYFGNKISSTEIGANIYLMKAWNAADRSSIIWDYDLSVQIKRDFFQAVGMSILLYGCTTWTLRKRRKKNLDGNYIRMLRALLNKSWK